MERATSSDRTSSQSDLSTLAWQILVLLAVYILAGSLGLQLAHYKEGVTLVWAPTGISLAALILYGRRLWPGVFIGALLVNLGNSSPDWISSIGIACGNTLEAVVGVTLLTRVADFRPTLERMRDGVAFLLIGVLGCTTISATIGVSSFYAVGSVDADSFALTWLNWWLGDMGGALVMTPALLTVVHGSPSWGTLARRFETWVALTSLMAASLFAFFGPDLGLVGLAVSVCPVPVLVWIGIRLGPRAATMATSLMILVAIIATASGSGPFVIGTTNEAMFLLWSYGMLIGITGFALTAVLEQRNLADLKYRLEEAERLRVEKRQLLLVERGRLTREMHDGLGGQLVSALAMVERGLAAPTDIAEVLRRAIDDIRIVIDSLDPTNADFPTSLGKLRARLEPLLRRNGIALTWSVDDRLGANAFPPESVLHILRIIQEAVTNTLRHANASDLEVLITLVEDDRRQLHLSISDNGCGVPTNMTIGGRGIANMKTRAMNLGAEFRITNSGSGTLIELAIPLSS